MINHIVSWNLNEEAKLDREFVLTKVKSSLEDLENKIEGVVKISVRIDLLNTSTADAVLISSFIDEEALNNYQKNEQHLKVAEYIKTVFCNRTCLDYLD
jgi:type III secretory pathway lipoprotein EscJ